MLSTLGPIKYHFSFILIRLNSRPQDIQLADCSVSSNWQWGALKRDKTPQGGSDVTRTWKRSERVSHEQQWEQGEQNREHGGVITEGKGIKFGSERWMREKRNGKSKVKLSNKKKKMKRKMKEKKIWRMDKVQRTSMAYIQILRQEEITHKIKATEWQTKASCSKKRKTVKDVPDINHT